MRAGSAPAAEPWDVFDPEWLLEDEGALAGAVDAVGTAAGTRPLLDPRLWPEADETGAGGETGAGAETEAGAETPTLRRGATGGAVRRLQQALVRAGHALAIDGDFGRRTLAAVRAFQADQRLRVDGVVGPATWARLLSGAPPAPPPSGLPTPGPPGDVDDPATVPLGTLVVQAPGRSLRYAFTADDLVWTAKLLVHESGGREDPDTAAVLWAMLNRYALFTHRVYGSFARFVRAYSTTLQPVLRSSGAAARHMHKPPDVFVRTGGTYPGTSIPKGQLQRHLDIQRAPWSAVRPSARRVALRGLTGELDNPGIGLASEFASTRIYFRQRHGRNPTPAEWLRFTEAHAARKRWRWVGEVPGIDQQRNAFFLDLRAATLAPDAVRVEPPAARGTGERDGEADAVESDEAELEREEAEEYVQHADAEATAEDGYGEDEDEGADEDEAYDDDGPEAQASAEAEDGAFAEGEGYDDYGSEAEAYAEGEDYEGYEDEGFEGFEGEENERYEGDVDTAEHDDGHGGEHAQYPASGGFDLEDELGSWAAALAALPGRVREALRGGAETLAVRLLVAAGRRDENWLANLVFAARHPELGGRAIRRDERDLAREWVAIRDRVVRPALRATPPATDDPAAARPRPGTRRTSSALRRAWHADVCRDSAMTRVRILGRWTPANRRTVAAWQALSDALIATGYRAERAWVYNCRDIRGTRSRSLHAYGIALDIDPTWNPNTRTPDRRPVRFSGAPTQQQRLADVRAGVADTVFTPEQVAAVEAISTVDGRQVFAWGGRWRTTKDTMHFQIDVTPEELARGLAV